MPLERDNLKAGLFVLIGIVLAVVVIFALADLKTMFVKTQTVTVAYKLSDGLKGLKEGAAVTLGDTPVGEVVSIRNEREIETGRVIGKLVQVKIPSTIPIFQNAIFELDVPTLGLGTKLNIRNGGEGEPYDPSTAIPGTLGKSELTRNFIQDMGIEDKQRHQIQTIIANIEALSAKLREDLPVLTGELKETVSQAKAAAADLRQAAVHIKTLMADVDDRRGRWFDRVDNVTGGADETMTRLRELIKDKDPTLRQIIDNVRDVTQHVREKTLAQVDQALVGATTAIDNFKTATEQFKALIVGQRPVIERALANAQLTTGQLKLAAIEIRRSPWRLLYKPGDEEMETDNLYDAARSFALAAGTLDATAQSLQTLASMQPSNDAEVKKILDYLEAVFGKFEKAENAFWEALKNQAPR